MGSWTFIIIRWVILAVWVTLNIIAWIIIGIRIRLSCLTSR